MIRVIGRSPSLQIGSLLFIERGGDDVAQNGVVLKARIGGDDGEGVLACLQDEILVAQEAQEPQLRLATSPGRHDL